jgi:hypothetical protein
LDGRGHRVASRRHSMTSCPGHCLF